MTLVVINRIDKEVSFSSDSRISFGAFGHFDKGIKIFNVHFRLKGPTSMKNFNAYEHELQYGLAVVGSSINAYTVKDSIAEILPNITYATNVSDVSIKGIGHLVCEIYKEVSEELKPILQKSGLCEILLGGYCLVEKKIRVLRFYSEINSTEIKYFFEEVLLKNGMMFFGSGKKIADRIIKEDATLSPLQVLKKVIQSKEDKAVGGALQHGAFYDKNFKINGIIEKGIDAAGDVKLCKKYRRGFILENEFAKLKQPPHLFVSYKYEEVKYRIEDK